jgi:hypothetical protein
LAAAVLSLLQCLRADVYAPDRPRLTATSEAALPRLANRVLLVVVDGLRADAALEWGLMPALARRAGAGAAGVALTGPVTTTALGIQTIATGAPVDLDDAFRPAPRPPVDSVLGLLARAGGRLVHVGNPVWREVFGDLVPPVDRATTRAARRAHQRDVVDGADTVWLEQALARLSRRDWDLAIVHLGGVDDANHLFTPLDPRSRAKLQRMDRDLERLYEAAGEQTTVVLTSDHGAGARGHHGGAGEEARRTPLVLSGPAIATGVWLDARQTDLAPTLAALLGLPIPAGSEGRVLLEALAAGPAMRQQIEARNLAQLRTHARTWAAGHEIAAPPLASPAGHPLAEWMAAERAATVLRPLCWALVAVLLAACFVLPGSTIARHPAALTLLLVTCLVGLVRDHTSTFGAFCALGVLTWVIGPPLLRAARASLPASSGGALLSVGAFELAGALWVGGLAQLPPETAAGPTAFLLAASAAGAVARMLRTRLAPFVATRAGGFVLLFAWAAAAQALPLPIGIAGAVAGVALVGGLGELLVAGGLGAVWMGTLGVRVPSGPVEVILAAALPLALGALALAVGNGGRRRTRIATLVVALAIAAVHAVGDPDIPFRLALGAAVGLVALSYQEDRARRREALGLAFALALALLCRGSQAPGVLVVVACAVVAGRQPGLSSGRPMALAASALIVVGLRMAFLSVCEGGFLIGNLEIHIAYLANPGAEPLFGGALVVAKFLLPMMCVLLLVGARLPTGSRLCGWVAACLLLRVAHLAAFLALARGSFAHPNPSTDELMYVLTLLGTLVPAGLLERRLHSSQPEAPGGPPLASEYRLS